jgi:hypothetical protein
MAFTQDEVESVDALFLDLEAWVSLSQIVKWYQQ